MRCVKCLGKHSSVDCTKLATDHPKCCNCGKEHPANYRGCLIAKELQKIRNKTMKGRLWQTKDLNTESVNKKPNSRSINQKSYSMAVKGQNQKQNDPNPENVMDKILKKLNEQESFNKILLSRLERLEQIVSK